MLLKETTVKFILASIEKPARILSIVWLLLTFFKISLLKLSTPKLSLLNPASFISFSIVSVRLSIRRRVENLKSGRCFLTREQNSIILFSSIKASSS